MQWRIGDLLAKYPGLRLRPAGGDQLKLAGSLLFVAKGSTDGPVEIAVNNPDDQATLKQAAQFPVVFHRTAGEPKEDSVEINPQ